MQKDFSLFILWPNSGFMEKQIINDIKKKFEIFRIFEICWKEERFQRNMKRLFGKKFYKEAHPDKPNVGNIKVYLVADSAPQYTEGVNRNISELKERFCQLGNLVETVDDEIEINQILFMLLGKNIKETESEGVCQEPYPYTRDLIGYPCWKSLEKALDIVRKLPFTHIKAYKNSYLIHTRFADSVRRLLNAESLFSVPGIHKYTIKIGRKKQHIYIRQVK